MSPPANDHLALALGLGAALAWSTAATAFELTLNYLDVYQLLFWSVLVTCIALASVAALTGRWRLLRRQTRVEWLHAGLLGMLNPCAYYLLLLEAYARLPGQIALAVNYSWPIALMLLSVPLLRHRITRPDAAAALVCYGGVLVVSLPEGSDSQMQIDPTGLALALSSTLVWAGYWIARTRESGDPVVGLLQSFLVALPCTAIVCAVFSDLMPERATGLSGAVWTGLFEMGITFVVWLQALRLASSAARVALLIYVSPFLSLIFLHFIAGEAIRPATLAGLALIVGALLCQQLAQQRPLRDTNAP